MNDNEKAVIAANRAFYEAFSHANMPAMESLWSERHLVSVIHPGWNAIHGREKVISSWKQIFEEIDLPFIQSSGERVYLMDDMAYVLCTEILEDGELVATNIFVYEDDQWKIMHHQAGPVSSPLQGTNQLH